jgi:hypothetical protein
MTNSDRLQEIRERVEKATPGPWQPTDEELADYRKADQYFIAASREDIPYLLQLVTEQREVLDSAVRFIESALVICARSCNPGDGLHVSRGEDICKAARALGPLNALEKLQQETEAKGYRKQERPI